MTDTNSDLTLMALLSAEDTSVETSTATEIDDIVSLPTLDQRVEMFLKAMHGADSVLTPDMRAKARDHLLTSMATGLAEETIPSAEPRNLTGTTTQRSVSVVAPMLNVLSQAWLILTDKLGALASSAANVFTGPRLRLVAAPLVALFVVSSALTIGWLNYGDHPEENPVANGPSSSNATRTERSRSLRPPVQSSDTVAEQNLKRQIASDEAALGSSHPTVARNVVDLAGLYRLDGRYKEAEALCNRALTIQQSTLGPKDPDTVRTLRELAVIYQSQGRTTEADELLKRANR